MVDPAPVITIFPERYIRAVDDDDDAFLVVVAEEECFIDFLRRRIITAWNFLGLYSVLIPLRARARYSSALSCRPMLTVTTRFTIRSVGGVEGKVCGETLEKLADI
jgi:hypothetical protein